MLKDIVAVQPLEQYRLQLRFEDGAEGIVDVRQLVRLSGVFAFLSDWKEFASVQVNPELGTMFRRIGELEALRRAVLGTASASPCGLIGKWRHFIFLLAYRADTQWRGRWEASRDSWPTGSPPTHVTGATTAQPC